ncbi:MAG: caspase family protein [Saprospiraceae bacterium]|nr:caspase family protein [Saprospiraceae bacterium]
MFHSFHIALNRLDPGHYPGVPDLRGPLNDAAFMERLTREVWGYRSATRLFNEQATAEAVLATLDDFAHRLRAGDQLLVTYSGHGGLVPDEYWQERGKDSEYNQTWCLYDRQLLDEELYRAYSRFAAGVRIFVISDSCHSGTVTKLFEEMAPEDAALVEHGYLSKSLEKDTVNTIYTQNQSLYDQLTAQFRDLPPNDGNIPARVRLFAACQDDQLAYDGSELGLFTQALKQVLGQEDAHRCPADELFRRIQLIYTYPEPNHLVYGGEAPDFDQSFPFAAAPVPAAEWPEWTPPVAAAPSPPPQHAAPPPKPAVYRLSVIPLSGTLSVGELENLFFPTLRSYTLSSHDHRYSVELDASAFDSEWGAVHVLYDKAAAMGLQLLIEPAFSRASDVVFYNAAAKASGRDIGWAENWPPISNKAFLPLGWHLGDEYSQLAAARDRVWAGIRAGTTKPIRIAHIDTGYDRYHPAFQRQSMVQHQLAKSFLHYERHSGYIGALDVYYGDGEVQGHGLGTLALLAGGYVTREMTQGDFEGVIGFVPFAHVIPLRIAETVVIMDGSSFSAAIDYAIRMKCEVATMSMAGKPSVEMARAVNRAYEAGLTLVSAAGNSWTEGFRNVLPKTVLYPARFQRVIAACGVCQNYAPYDIDAQKQLAAKGIDYFQVMQGNWGPEGAMNKALAAFTPNLPWANGEKDAAGRIQVPFKKGGGGTSSATPQIAAAAALWIMQHRQTLDAKGYSGTWKQVEAVRKALFDTADKNRYGESKKYYGNGIVQAAEALDYPCPDIVEADKAPEAESSWTGIQELVKLLFNRRRAGIEASAAQQAAMAMEIQHVLYADPALHTLAETLDGGLEWSAEQQRNVENALRKSPYASRVLTAMLA